MGATKTDLFSSSQVSFARIAKAIGHPARIAILQILDQEDYYSNKALAKRTQLSEGTIQQHLQELKRAGLVSEIFLGKFHFYTIHGQSRSKVESLIGLFEENK